MSESPKVSVCKLSSYTAAAALGAFAVPHGADAGVVYTQVDPDVEVDWSYPRNQHRQQARLCRIGFYHHASNTNIRSWKLLRSNADAKAHYYVEVLPKVTSSARIQSRGCSPVSSVATEGTATTSSKVPISTSASLSKLMEQVHYGWVGFQVDSTNPLHGIIRDYAYESTPGTAIEAGAVPEPGSLAFTGRRGGGDGVPSPSQRLNGRYS